MLKLLLTTPKQKMVGIFVALLTIAGITTVSSRNSGLSLISQCICPGYNATYECSISGIGRTIWTGTGFRNCPGNVDRIILRHNQFSSLGGAIGTCNSGTIVGQSIGVQDADCYISQLDVFVTSDIVGTTIVCSHDNGSAEFMEVGRSTLTTTTDPLPPPSNVMLTSVNRTQLTFSWDPPDNASDCLAVKYNILTENCGSCPMKSNTTTVDCTNPQPQPNPGTTCAFTVQTEVCDGVVGGASDTHVARLRVPDIPVITAIPTYSQSEKTLTSISVGITELAPFSISDQIDGSTTFYNIRYINSTSGELCNSVTIPASSCANGVCNHEFNLSSSLSLCSPSTAISVTVFASNILGDGEVSQEFTFDEVNNFVDVSVDTMTRRFTCTFMNEQDHSEKSCSITLYRDCKEQDVLTAQASSTESQITLAVDSLQSDNSVYCYVVAASNDTIVLNINGTIGQTGVSQGSNTGAIVGGILGALAFITIIALLILGSLIGVRLGKIPHCLRLKNGDSIDGNSENLIPVDDNRFIELPVKKDCELKTFIEDKNLTFQRGAAFYEFTRAEEDIKFDKEVILMDKKTKKLYTGRAACDMIGAPGEGIRKPTLPKYRVFVQSKGIGVRPLGPNSLLLYERNPGPSDAEKSYDLTPVDSNRQFQKIDVTMDCELQEFIESYSKLTYKPGCAFYEFKSDKEDISERKEVLLMDKNTQEIFTGPGVLLMIGAPGRDIERPTLGQWRVFIQSMQGNRFVSEGTLLLYEDLGSDADNLQSVNPGRLEKLDVKKTCNLRDFVEKTHKLVPYNPRRFFFEFVGAKENISDDKEIIVMDKDTKEMFTGSKAKEMIGAPNKEVRKPSLNKYRVFVQNGGGGSRCLKPGTSVLYEKNYQF